MIAWHAALAQVFYLKKNPQALHAMQQAPLPDGMASVMRLASDSGNLLDSAANELGMDATLLQTAVSEYLMAVCLFPSSHASRVLGLNEKSSPETAREHYRLLLKWLHPDKNQQNKNYAERVNQAWSTYKSSEYGYASTTLIHASSAQMHEPRQLPASRFPIFVVGLLCLALGLLAIAFLPDNTAYVSGVDNAELESEKDNFSEIPSELEANLIDRIKNIEEQQQPTVPLVSPVQAVVTKEESPVSIQDITKIQSQVDIQSNKKDIQQQVSVVAKTKQPDVIMPIELNHPEHDVGGNAVQLHAEPILITEQQGMQFLNDYAMRYQKGDINSFMQLFSATAHGDKGNREAIAKDYRQFFADSLNRQIQFSELQWRQRNQNILSMHAFFAIKIQWHKMWHKIKYSNKSNGQIELDLILENGQVRIQQILIKQ